MKIVIILSYAVICKKGANEYCMSPIFIIGTSGRSIREQEKPLNVEEEIHSIKYELHDIKNLLTSINSKLNEV